MRPHLRFNSQPGQRLFSNVESDGKLLKHRPGSLLGCTALVAGTTVGAGILALPAVTLNSGVVPSTVMLLAVWFYALVAALLLAEVSIKSIRNSGRPGLGLLAMTASTLGQGSARIAGGAYLFLHYALLIAYMAQGGSILTAMINQLGLVAAPFPPWSGTILFATLFGGILYFGRDKLVETLNSAFVTIVLGSFLGLVALGVAEVNPSQFLAQDWGALGPAISVMFVALFYHTVVPVITTQLEGDVQKIRQSIVIGSAIPLVMFLVWNAVILGSISPELLPDLSPETVVFDPLAVLRNGDAGNWLGVMVSIFSEFAIATSFIGFTYGLLDFFQDALDMRPDANIKGWPLYSLVLLPPIGFSTLNPNIFFTALDYAGTFSISVLSGILPAVMAWQLRYASSDVASDVTPVPICLVPGGKVTLTIMIGMASAAMGRQALCLMGL